MVGMSQLESGAPSALRCDVLGFYKGANCGEVAEIKPPYVLPYFKHLLIVFQFVVSF